MALRLKEIRVVKLARRRNCWSVVRVTLQSWRSWRLNYSPVLQRFAGGHALDNARRNPDFSMYEFEIVTAVQAVLDEALKKSPSSKIANDERKTLEVAKVLDTFMKRHKGKPYSHSALALAIAPKLEIKYTRLRTYYLPAIAKSSPYWHGNYWECIAD